MDDVARERVGQASLVVAVVRRFAPKDSPDSLASDIEPLLAAPA